MLQRRRPLRRAAGFRPTPAGSRRCPIPLIEAPFGAIDYEHMGAGDDLVLLLHATGSTHTSLKRLAAALADGGRRVVLPALAGYGQTRVDLAGTPYLQNVELIRFLLSQLPARKIGMVGQSTGSLVPLRAAFEGLRIDAAVAYEPIIFGVLDPARPEDAAALAWDAAIVRNLDECLARGEAEAGISRFIEAWNEFPWDRFPDHLKKILIREAPRINREAQDRESVSVSAATFAKLDLPVLIMYGATTRPEAKLICRRLVEAIPGARLAELEGLGHMGPVIKPGELARATNSFLDEVFARP